jgi:hypothetical protein
MFDTAWHPGDDAGGMRITKPTANTIFSITSAAVWPRIVFATDGSGPHRWQWRLAWGEFSASGTELTAGNTWDAATAVANRGGLLAVLATAGEESAAVDILVRGMNPSQAEVLAYLATKADSAGFERIVGHESKFRHFNSKNEPIRSFDNGFGMCQLTTPKPSFEEVWNWQRNLDGGLRLFAEKLRAARTHLSQSGRTFSPDQLAREAICRWNGGSYHRWDPTANKWIRPAHILCDSMTGNIGWDLTNPENAGKTEAQLHARDEASYRRPPGPGAHWKYIGICYADRLFG